MHRLVFISLFLFCLPCRADVATESWPEKIKDFPLDADTLHLKSFVITAKEASDQSAGGSGGRIYDITVQNTRSETKLVLNEQSVGIRVLALYRGWPQLEIWGRGGGGSWSRSLYRVTKADYEYVRTDEFTSFEPRATNKSRTTTMPKDDVTLYYVETRLPSNP